MASVPYFSVINAGKCRKKLTQKLTPKLGGAFGGLIFPSDEDRSVAIRTDVLSRWLKQAEQKAKLAKLDGSLWHSYRRAWATGSEVTSGG